MFSCLEQKYDTHAFGYPSKTPMSTNEEPGLKSVVRLGELTRRNGEMETSSNPLSRPGPRTLSSSSARVLSGEPHCVLNMYFFFTSGETYMASLIKWKKILERVKVSLNLIRLRLSPLKSVSIFLPLDFNPVVLHRTPFYVNHSLTSFFIKFVKEIPFELPTLNYNRSDWIVVFHHASS